MKGWRPCNIIRCHPMVKVVTKKGMEWSPGWDCPWKPYTDFSIWVLMSCMSYNQGTACKGLAARFLPFCASRFVCSYLLSFQGGRKKQLRGMRQTCAGLSLPLWGRWTGSLILDHIAACSKASCIPQLLHNFFAYGRELASCWGNCAYICCFCAETQEGKNP